MSSPSSQTASGTTCLVLLTDSLYLPGTKRLLESWDQHNPSLDAVVLSRNSAILEDPQLVARCKKRIKIDTTPYEDIQPYKKRRSRRHAETFYKFEAFGNFGYEQTLFLDSDILCLRHCPELLSVTKAQLRAATDTGFKKTRAYKGHANEINSGVLLIAKEVQGHRTIECLQNIAREQPGRGGYNSGDQGIINKWIHKESIELDPLPNSYNLIKKDYQNLDDLDGCHLLHFADKKPWIPTNQSREPLESLWLDA